MQTRISIRLLITLFLKCFGIYLFLVLFASLFSTAYGQMISQYIETNSGSTPKGIEVWNNTGSDIVFSTTNNLRVFQGTNGGGCAQIISITSGTLEAGKVWVIGTSDLTNFANTNGTSLSGTTTFTFTFNGDDALQLYLGTTLKDVIGTCGSDPGSAWSGGGVSTENQNISILSSISTGTTTNWTNPSLRFENTANGSTMTGFGNAPVSSCSSPDAIAFEVQPSNVQQSTNMTAVRVKAICSGSGAVATSYSGNITLTLNTPGCGYTSQTVAAVNGIATFSSIQILRSPQSNLSFTASAAGFTSITSSTFNVTTPAGTPVVTTITQNNFDALTSWNYTIGTPTTFGSGGSAGTDVVNVIAQSGSNVLRKSFSTNNSSGERGTSNTVTFDNVTGLAGYNQVDFSFQVFSFGSGTGAGADNGDDFFLEVSTNGGATWTTILTQEGASDRLFALSSAPVTALSLSTNSSYAKPDTKSAFSLSLTGVSEFQFRFTAKNNRSNENWAIDNVILRGTTIPIGVAFNLPTADAGADFAICNESQAQLNVSVSSYQAPLTYLWNNAAQLNNASIQNPLATPSGATQTFTVTITDAHNCKATDAVMITNTGFGGTAGLWTGAFDENWFDCRNWSNGQIPTTSTIVVINQTATNACRITDDPAVCGSLTISSNNGTHPDLTIETTGSLIVSNNTTIQKTAGSGTTKLVLLDQANFRTQNLSIQGYTAGAGNAKLEHEKNTTTCIVFGDVSIQTGGELDMSDGDNATQDGRLILHGNYTNNATEGDFKQSTSTVEFAGSNNQTITTNAFNEVFYNVVLNKPAGNVTLANSIDIENQVQFVSGDVITGVNLLSFYDNATHSGVNNSSHVNGKVRKIGNDAFTFPIGNGTYYRPAAITAPGNTAHHFTANYVLSDPDLLYDDASKDATLDHISSCEYWIIDRTNGTSNVQVQLSWAASTSCGVSNLSELRVTRWNGTMWKDYSNTGTTGNAAAGTIWSNSVTAFSPFTLASITVNNPLPVTLTRWDVVCNESQHHLIWETASEQNADYFDVYRSEDGVLWEQVTSVSAQGNSTQLTSYSWSIDARSEAYYYRLTQTDFDGKVNELGIRMAGCSASWMVYPNPFQHQIQVQWSVSDEPVFIELLDAQGRKIQEEWIREKNQITWQTDHLPIGLYLIRVNNQVDLTFKIMKI